VTLLAVLLLGLQQQALTDAACIKCHEEAAADVKGTLHEKAGVGCVSCHGTDEIVNEKHKRTASFRPARLPHVAQVCGECHQAVFEAFKPSEHFAAASRDDGEPKHRSSCSACHEYHSTPKADRTTILKLCLPCHEKGSHEYKEGAAAFESMDRHGDSIRKLTEHVKSLASAPGIRIFDVEEAVEDARRASTRLRIAQHGLDWKRLKADAAASADGAAAAYNTLAAREESFARRFLGLGLFLGLLALSAVLIVRRARTLGAS